MSGGQLVVVDRSGRDVKPYRLASGLATLGSDLACDIRFISGDVEPHHATVVVHATQTLVRNVGSGVTLVNGRAVSVSALRHGDLLTVADRSLRWEYDRPQQVRNDSSPVAALTLPVNSRSRRGRRSAAAAGGARDPGVRLALEMRHRASMPGSAGGKQVAVVQPQRRDLQRPVPDAVPGTRRTPAEHDRQPSRTTQIQPPTTKATLWIESRKGSPRRRAQSAGAGAAAGGNKSTPLRLTVLRKAQSAHKHRVVKIEAPSNIDHTKQAAIMLMTGHKSISPQNQKKSPSFVVKKPSPVRKSARAGRTPSRGTTFVRDVRRSSKGNTSVTILEISDATQNSTRYSAQNSTRYSSQNSNRNLTQNSTRNSSQNYSPDSSQNSSLDSSQNSMRNSARNSPRNSTVRASNISGRSRGSPLKSPALPSPKKSSMKDLSRKSSRKTESIKFDLSNLSGHRDGDTTYVDSDTGLSEDEMTLRYSEDSRSPAGHSRASRILARLGASVTSAASPGSGTRSPGARRSIRGSIILQRALESSKRSESTRSDLTDATVASASRTRTLSPRDARRLETYSVVDLVSLDSADASASVYDSASANTSFGTPEGEHGGRRTRSGIDPALLSSSTPYAARARSRSGPDVPRRSTRGPAPAPGPGRRSQSLSTPENRSVSARGARRSRAAQPRSRVTDASLLLLDDTEPEDASPRTSKRTRASKSLPVASPGEVVAPAAESTGISTPENRGSPEEAGTPVLSIRSLLDSSRGPGATRRGRGRRSGPARRKTIGVVSRSKRRDNARSKSLNASIRRTVLRLSRESAEGAACRPADEVTPRSAVEISVEAVKNKHSTAKKPQSKRSIIDDLDRSDIVKQLFNSPVKRKLSQSMTEFSRRHLAEDALAPLERTAAITPDRLSPPPTPDGSPHLTGVDRLFRYDDESGMSGAARSRRSAVRGGGAKSPSSRRGDVRPRQTSAAAPRDDPRRVSGVKALFRRTSPENDLTDVRGVRRMFRRKSPENDLRDVSGVKRILRKSPRNDLSDVRGVRGLFRQKSAENDLRDVSGVKRIVRKSPRNDLSDVRGVRGLFRNLKRDERSLDVSGVERLFEEADTSATRAESLFDKMAGEPTVRAVYSNTFSGRSGRNVSRRRNRSLRASRELLGDVEGWLERELRQRLQTPAADRSSNAALRKLATDTLQGAAPLRTSRTRNASYAEKSLPLKKRSLETGLPRLPIKKRAVVHSTPVKGRAALASPAAELSRVSPIRPQRASLAHQELSAPLARSTQMISPEKAEGDKPAPRKQHSPKKSTPTHPAERATRVSRNKRTPTKTKKRQSSVVITKRAPEMIPKPVSEASAVTSPKPSPKRTRTARAKRDATIVPSSPRATRANKKAVIASPESPRPTRGRGAQTAAAPPRARRGRRAAQPAAPASGQEPTEPRGRRAAAEPITEAKKPIARSKKKEVVLPASPPAAKRGRGRRAQPAPEPIEEKKSEPRGRKVRFDVAPEPPTEASAKTRVKRNVTVAETSPVKVTRGRGRQVAAEVVAATARGAQAAAAPRPSRGRKDDPERAPETAGRKRRGAPAEEVPAKLAKLSPKKGKKAATPAKQTPTPTKRAPKTRKTASTATVAETAPTATEAETKEKSTRSTRGAKLAVDKRAATKVVIEQSPAATRGKRNRTKLSPKKAASASTQRAPASPPASTARRRGRAAPAAASPTKTTGRRRR